MKKINKVTRRTFLQKASLGLGLGIVGSSNSNPAFAKSIKPVDKSNRLPREVWIASLTLERLNAQTYEEVIKNVFIRMDNVLPYQPDIVCLPETFPFAELDNIPRPHLAEVAEIPLGPISSQFAKWAKKNHCYVVCPIYTKEDSHYYNSAVVIGTQINCKLLKKITILFWFCFIIFVQFTVVYGVIFINVSDFMILLKKQNQS